MAGTVRGAVLTDAPGPSPVTVQRATPGDPDIPSEPRFSQPSPARQTEFDAAPPRVRDDGSMTTADAGPWPGGGYALRSRTIIDDLDELCGPRTGVFELPLHLNASAPRRFDLGNPTDRLAAYQLVLLEATSRGDLTDWLYRDELIRFWPDLYLPRQLRQAWQDRHASLRERGAGPNVPQP